METWSGYRFHMPNKQVKNMPATLKGQRLLIEGEPSLTLDKFIGSGSQGMVFASRDLVIKLETADGRYPGHIEFYMNLNEWASDNDVGPKFFHWGTVAVDSTALAYFKSVIKGVTPYWLEADEPGQIYYSVYERWDSDLNAYLRHNLNRLYAIEPAVMQKFAERIRRLHQRQVVHLDLMPKNILVRVRDDRVTDMVITDFGFARPRSAWFFNVHPERRDRLVRYYAVQEQMTKNWAQQLGKQEFAEWLKYEPFNADWCLYANYALLRNLPVLKQLGKPPPYFNFQLPWSIQGWLQVKITDGKKEIQLAVHGLMSLVKLRESLSKQSSFNMKKFKFQGIKIKDERRTYPSSVIDNGTISLSKRKK